MQRIAALADYIHEHVFIGPHALVRAGLDPTVQRHHNILIVALGSIKGTDHDLTEKRIVLLQYEIRKDCLKVRGQIILIACVIPAYISAYVGGLLYS